MGLIQQLLTTNPLIELGIVSLILVLMGYTMRLLKQPVIIGYILGGLILGPQLLDVIQHQDNIAFYAHFGVSLLLFMVGLGLNPKIIHEVGKIAVIAGTGQVIFTSVIGFGLALALGFPTITAIFIAIALTFSSTIIIVKLISDRGDTHTNYGKIALGILIIQDIIAMLLLMVISSGIIGGTSSQELDPKLILAVIGLLGFARGAAKYALPYIMHKLSYEKELMLLFVITRAIILGGMRYFFGFSMEIGALLAGVSLASSRYRFHIFSELRPFRDFFLALFFVYLGGQIVFDGLGAMIIPIILFSAFVLIGNPCIIIALMMKLGHKARDSFMTGLTVAQISEFSFIMIGLTLTMGILDDPTILSLVTIIGLITMTGSSYLFAHADKIYQYVKPYLQHLDHHHKNKQSKPAHHDYQVILVGYGRVGQYIARKLNDHQIKHCIIDNDPTKITEGEKRGYDMIYGDVNENDLLDQLMCSSVSLVLCTIYDHDIAIHVTQIAKEHDPHLRVVMMAQYLDEAGELYSQGVDYVVFPHLKSAHDSREILEKHIRSPDEFIDHTVQHRKNLAEHKEYLHKA